MGNDFIILGAGGHAKVAIETARSIGFNPTAVYDDDETLIGTNLLGVPVVGKIIGLDKELTSKAFLAIGSNKIRQKIVESFPALDWQTLVHKQAYVCESAIIGDGTLVCAGVTVQPDCCIGKQVILNTGANIDHDCIVEDFVHICPGTNLAGAVKIGAGSTLGIGTNVIQLKTIGAWSIIGAGSVVVKDIPKNSKAFGVPAKVVSKI
jgi:sugar O-acyltransferase (sialic acid O-acetyltransferase NeuD family)